MHSHRLSHFYMIEMSKLYKSIDFLNTEIYKSGKQHPLIYIKAVSTRGANRIPIKLKVVSGQYRPGMCFRIIHFI
jgi:hypothetical protein